MRRTAGYTLIELVVVIAVVALLMAILLPPLRAARRQAKEVVCRSNLKQWGTMWATYDDKMRGFPRDYEYVSPWPRYPWVPVWGFWGRYPDRDWYAKTEGIRCCPMATEIADPTGEVSKGTDAAGGTFLAWGRFWPKGTGPWPEDSYGSYGTNGWLYYWPRFCWHEGHPYYWRSLHVKGASNVPLHLDSWWPWGWPEAHQLPPALDAVPTPSRSQPWGNFGLAPWINVFCINRHNGYVNCVFLDYSVRKVGLKELWTLKWHRQYDTSGPWTKAGGVQPDDWPEWMKRFKDY